MGSWPGGDGSGEVGSLPSPVCFASAKKECHGPEVRDRETATRSDACLLPSEYVSGAPPWGGSVLQLEDPGSCGHKDSQCLENTTMEGGFK